MTKYMLLEAEPITQADIDQAIKRAHAVRSEATWTAIVKVSDWVSQRFQSASRSNSGFAPTS